MRVQTFVYTRTFFRYSPPNVHMSRSFVERKHATTASAAVPVGSSLYRALTAPRTLTALVLIGVILRLWAYLADTALYLDEILLSYSILNLPLVDLLTRPLPIDQVGRWDFYSSNAARSQFSATMNSRSDFFLSSAQSSA